MSPIDPADAKETHTIQVANHWPLGTVWVSSSER